MRKLLNDKAFSTKLASIGSKSAKFRTQVLDLARDSTQHYWLAKVDDGKGGLRDRRNPSRMSSLINELAIRSHKAEAAFCIEVAKQLIPHAFSDGLFGKCLSRKSKELEDKWLIQLDFLLKDGFFTPIKANGSGKTNTLFDDKAVANRLKSLVKKMSETWVGEPISVIRIIGDVLQVTDSMGLITDLPEYERAILEAGNVKIANENRRLQSEIAKLKGGTRVGPAKKPVKKQRVAKTAAKKPVKKQRVAKTANKAAAKNVK